MEGIAEVAHVLLFQELLPDHDDLLDRPHAKFLPVVDQKSGDLCPEHTT